MSTNELIKPVVDIDWTSITRYEQFEKRGWAKDENGTYSVSAMHPEIDDWIREQNPDMYELLEYSSYWFKNPKLETLFLLRWS